MSKIKIALSYRKKRFIRESVILTKPDSANMMQQTVPYRYSAEDKKKQVARMFNKIAGTYDLLNHLLSFGMDIYWRRQVVKKLAKSRPSRILDLATGTGDLAIATASLQPEKIYGVDIAPKMLEIGKNKLRQKKLENMICLEEGDSENLRFENNTFDAITVAFGVRNFENLEKGLKEMYRVLQNGGQAVILEFGKPDGFPFKQIYQFYFLNLLPLLGKMLSKDQHAYTYLPNSVMEFPTGKSLTDLMEKCGFKETSCDKLSLGICSLYTGIK